MPDEFPAPTGYGGSVHDPETSWLVPALARLNRAGLVTDFSQPGQSGDYQQRAAVADFCDDAVMWQLRAATLGTELVVLAYPPGAPNDGLQIPVSLDGDEECTWVGGVIEVEDLVHMYGDDVHRAGVLALATAWQVTVMDPQWGRDDLLWPIVDRLSFEQPGAGSEGERLARAIDERINPGRAVD